MRGNLYAAAKKPVRTVIGGQVYILKVRVFESFGEDAFEVSIDPAPKLDPSITPSFTAKQGQYLAFIYNYTKIHGQPPAESDLERYFQGFPARDSRDDQDPGAQRPDRKNSWAGPIHSPPVYNRSTCRDWSRFHRFLFQTAVGTRDLFWDDVNRLRRAISVSDKWFSDPRFPNDILGSNS